MTINTKKLKLSTYSIFFILFLSSCSEPIERINAGKDCKKCNLSNADLSGLTLNGIDLTGADLSGANLSNTKILGVNFTDAVLKDTDLSNSEMDLYDDGSSITILHNEISRLQNRFLNSDLSGANLENATMEWTIFLNSNLTNANLRNVETTNTKFKNVNFTNSILANFNFETGEVISPTTTTAANPMSTIVETNTLVAKSNKSNLAKEMFFSDYHGMISTIADPENYRRHITNILRSFNVFDIVQENGEDSKFFGTNQEIGYDTIREYYDDYYPEPIERFICEGY